MGYVGGGGIGSGAGAGGIEGAPRDSHFFPRARFPQGKHVGPGTLSTNLTSNRLPILTQS